MLRIGKAFRSLVEHLQRLITKKPFLSNEREYREKLSRCAERLAQSDRKLSEVRSKLQERTESVGRLAQRYDEQARKHHKLHHRDLAQAAIRQRVKVRIQVRHWEERVDELERCLQRLKARQSQLAAGSLRTAPVLEELSEIQATLERTEEQIHQVRVQIEAPLEQQEGEVSALL